MLKLLKADFICEDILESYCSKSDFYCVNYLKRFSHFPQILLLFSLPWKFKHIFLTFGTFVLILYFFFVWNYKIFYEFDRFLGSKLFVERYKELLNFGVFRKEIVLVWRSNEELKRRFWCLFCCFRWFLGIEFWRELWIFIFFSFCFIFDCRLLKIFRTDFFCGKFFLFRRFWSLLFFGWFLQILGH